MICVLTGPFREICRRMLNLRSGGWERWMVPPIPEMAILRLSKEEDYLLM